MTPLNSADLQAQSARNEKIKAASELNFGLEQIRRSKQLRCTAVELTDLVQRVIGWDANMPSALKRLHELFGTYPEYTELYTAEERKLLRYQVMHLNHHGVFDYT